MAVRWAARRAAASQTGSDGAAWLNGKAARAMSCDATVIPVVIGQLDPGALDELVSLCLHMLAMARIAEPGDDVSPPHYVQAHDSRSERAHRVPTAPPAGLHPPTAEALELLRHAIIGKTTNLLVHSSDLLVHSSEAI